MFKKIGENMPILSYIDPSGIILCPDCQEPMDTIEMDEDGDDTITILCKCKNPEME